jgi:hypothetical protein
MQKLRNIFSKLIKIVKMFFLIFLIDVEIAEKFQNVKYRINVNHVKIVRLI